MCQCFIQFLFNDTATTEIYTLSLHDALPISVEPWKADESAQVIGASVKAQFKITRLAVYFPSIPHSFPLRVRDTKDRKSTRLNSSHANISYAVFCLKKKNRSTAFAVPQIAIY